MKRETTSVLPLPAEMLERLRALVSQKGEAGAHETLGIPRGTIARAAAGYPVRAGTAALFRERLGAREAAS
jgi:hypothetical protein